MSESDKLKETVTAYSADPKRAEIDALAEAIYQARVQSARQTSLEDKALAGQRLFESACEVTLWGIRNQYPEKSDEQHRGILRERLAWRRKQQASTCPRILN